MSDNNNPQDPHVPEPNDGTSASGAGEPPAYNTDQPVTPDAGGPPAPPVPPAPPEPPYNAPQQPPQQATPQPYGVQPGSIAPPPPSPYGAGTPPQNAGGKGLAITALVLSIVGALLCFIPFAAFGGVPIAIVALILAIVALVKKANGKGMSIAALIVSGVGVLVGAVMVFITISMFVFFDTYQNEFDQLYDENPELFDEQFDDDFGLLEQPDF